MQQCKTPRAACNGTWGLKPGDRAHQGLVLDFGSGFKPCPYTSTGVISFSA